VFAHRAFSAVAGSKSTLFVGKRDGKTVAQAPTLVEGRIVSVLRALLKKNNRRMPARHLPGHPPVT
jgi:hypothetical protein